MDRRHRRARTKPAVTGKVRELELQRDTGTARRAGPVPTVEQWLRTWLDTIAVRSVKASTLDRSYRSKVEHWIIPSLGRHRLDRLQPEHLDAFYVGLAADGLAAATVVQVHRVLSRALKVAVQRQIIVRNVCTLVDAPRPGVYEPMPLNAREARAVVQVAAERQRHAARWAVAVTLGLRQGEALGLRRPFLDLDNGEIRVDWQLQREPFRHGCADPHACGSRLHRYPCPKDCPKAKRTAGRTHTCRNMPCPRRCAQHTPGGCVRFCEPGCTRHERSCPQRVGGWVFTRPKGNRRTVPIPPQLIPILRAERETQQAERAIAGEAWDDRWDLVWCQPDGRPIEPHADWQEWKNLLHAAGVGKNSRLHDARHTAGTLLSGQDVNLQVIKEILGHAQISTTLTYTHAVTGPARRAAARIGDLLWDQPSTPTATATATRGCGPEDV